MEDSEGGLFTVTLFKKAVDEFKAKARENKFAVREFNFNEKELQSEKEEMTRLAADKKQQYGPLLRWLKVNFSEAFIAWIHVKALRVFVESVLRYGLPVNFQALLLQPNKKSMKRLRDVLNALYKHLDSVAAASVADGPLLRWLKVNFSEAFIAWIHVKALRVFVESVLRYGLPVNFQALLLQPNKKSMKRLRDVLNALYKHLDSVAAASVADAVVDIPGLSVGNQDYYSYVYFKIDLNLIDQK
ncbi:UNVERIFIED_CONTAM: hypothetical protein FKN15_052003 [Acipenser sinensis]